MSKVLYKDYGGMFALVLPGSKEYDQLIVNNPNWQLKKR